MEVVQGDVGDMQASVCCSRQHPQAKERASLTGCRLLPASCWAPLVAAPAALPPREPLPWGLAPTPTARPAAAALQSLRKAVSGAGGVIFAASGSGYFSASQVDYQASGTGAAAARARSEGNASTCACAAQQQHALHAPTSLPSSVTPRQLPIPRLGRVWQTWQRRSRRPAGSSAWCWSPAAWSGGCPPKLLRVARNC